MVNTYVFPLYPKAIRRDFYKLDLFSAKLQSTRGSFIFKDFNFKSSFYYSSYPSQEYKIISSENSCKNKFFD